MAAPAKASIGLIIGSTRNPRIGPKIAAHVLSILKASSPESPEIETIDLKDFNLPLFDESTIPAQVKSPEGYSQEHTRVWSKEISKHSAFIFVTPQYNWSFPAGLKNAIDYLFNEWTGKPAMIVSYGGRGGGKGALALRGALEGLRMNILEKMIEYSLSEAEGGNYAAQHRGELADGLLEKWEPADEDLKAAFRQFLELSGPNQTQN